MEIKLKRAYEQPDQADGARILVDRLWPRGLSKEQARIDVWVKELAPSTALRRWYGHDPQKWREFNQRYVVELEANRSRLEELLPYLRQGPVTLVFSSKELRLNNAVALKNYLERLV